MQLLLLFSHNLRPAPGQAWEGHEGGYNTEGHRGAPSPPRKPDPRGIVAGQWAGGGWGGDDAMGGGPGLFSTWWGSRAHVQMAHVQMPHCGPRESPPGPAGVCGDRCCSNNRTDQM